MNAPWPITATRPPSAPQAMPEPWHADIPGATQAPAAPYPAAPSLAAYLADEASLACLRDCLASLGLPAKCCQIATLDEAVEALAMAPASPEILLIDLSGLADPLADLPALAQVCAPGTLVIAIGQTNDVQLYRALLASGIHDYLLKPLSMPQLADAIADARAALASATQAGAAPASQHLTTVVIGTRGGVGATTLATALAWLSSTDLAQPTALLDLDIAFGTGALSLDLEPGQGLVDAIDNPARIDGLFIERAMIRASDTLAILSAEAPVATTAPADGGALLHLAEELRHAFTATVIDLPRALLATTTQLLAEAGSVVLVTELTLAGARDTIRILGHVRAHAPLARVILVANKVPSGLCEIGPGDFEAAIERNLDFLLPCEPHVAITAAKHGQSFAEANRTGRLGEGLAAIARAASATGDGTTAPASRARPSLLARLGSRGFAGGWLGALLGSAPAA